MFPYDSRLAACTQAFPRSIPDVLAVMHAIDQICLDADGLRWFNWLYLQVTQAVENRVSSGGFNDPAWLAQLDVQFAALYFNALNAALTGAPCPACWLEMFSARDQVKVARIQFAFAGMNAHINHDLPFAIVATCKATNTIPQRGTPQDADYTAVNPILDGLVDSAKKTLNVRLPGDALPPVSHLEDLLAQWNLAEFRGLAWKHAETLWQGAVDAAMLKATIDTLTALAGRALLVPVP
ncbi:MAG TPA: DUF5995 family protein [Verrucomicrobiae bacterium]|nr:DUF5995 family protein [Verrucomicrobiae bacterium]